MRFIPHSYQQYAIDRILEQPKTALYLDMGLGKTVCSLTAVEQLLHDRFPFNRFLGAEYQNIMRKAPFDRQI